MLRNPVFVQVVKPILPVLNEVLSLNAQEWDLAGGGGGVLVSSMKS